MKPLHCLGWAAAALVLVTMSGCGKSGSGKPRVAFVSNNPESFWNIAEAGATKAADEAGVELLFRKPDSSDAGLQQDKVDQVINEGIKAVAISVIDPRTQNRYLSSVAKKVKLLTVDNDAPESGRVCYIGTDNYEAGRAAGALVKEALPRGGTVVIFVGSLEGLNAQQRRQGVLDELSGKKDVEIKDGTTYGEKYRYYKTYTDQPTGQARANENAVQALTDLKKEKDVCLVGLWAYNPPAIIAAAESQGAVNKVKIVAFDEDPRTLKAIADGSVVGTIVQQPYEFGYRSVKVMAAIAKGEKPDIPADGLLYVPHFAVTKDGHAVTTAAGKKTKGREVEEFRQALNKLLGKG